MTGTQQPLPRGRHGIDREDVRANQRGRIVDATIECVAERGYAPTTVGQIVARARVSRETFYELFSDKASCYEESLSTAVGAIADAYEEAVGDTSLTPSQRLERGLRSYFGALAAHPDLTTCLILESPGRGRAAGLGGEPTAELHRRDAELYDSRDPFVVEAYLALLDGFVRRYVAAGRTTELPEVVDELLPVLRRVLDF